MININVINHINVINNKHWTIQFIRSVVKNSLILKVEQHVAGFSKTSKLLPVIISINYDIFNEYFTALGVLIINLSYHFQQSLYYFK